MLSAAWESIGPFRRIPGGIRDVVRRCIFYQIAGKQVQTHVSVNAQFTLSFSMFS